MAASGLAVVTAGPASAVQTATPLLSGEAKAGPPEPIVADDVLSAQLTARAKGVPVEVEALRSETATTYVNPDGSFTAEQFAGPVRFRRAGQWAEVDTTLERRADGSVAPKGSPSGLVLSGARADSGKPQALMTVGSGAQQSVWQWQGALPEPELSGDTATYVDVQPGVDLIVQASRTGFEQFFRLRERPSGVVRFALPVKLGADANLRETADGGLRVTRDSGGELGRGPAPMMWDARLNAAGEPLSPRRVATQVAAAAGGAVVTLSPEDAFLADPATQYPVMVDPEVSYTPTLDTWVASNDTTPHSGSVQLPVGWNGSMNHRAYINFPWSLKSDATILSSTLSLWSFYAGSCTATGWQMWSTQSGAGATTSTIWSNAPTLYSNYGSSTQTKGGTGCAAGWVTMNAQTMSQNWSNANYTNMNIGLRATTEGDFDFYKKFNSGDASSNIPKLTVTYNRKPSTPLQSSLQVAPDSRYGSTHYANTTTPKVSTLVTDPDGGSVKAQISIYLVDPVTGDLTTVSTLNSGTMVASGSRSSWTVPAGQLTNGNTYRFYARAHDGSLQSASASAGLSFTVDTSVPSAPTVASTSYPSTGWYGAAGQAGNFTLTPPASDVGWLLYALDSTSTSAANTVVATAATAQTVSITPPTPGAHTLSVWTKDKAGNLSARTSYAFNVGTAALAGPLTGDTTAKHVALTATAASGATGAKFQYRFGGAAAEDNWVDVPVANTTLNGSSLSSWPVTPITANGTATTSGLLWDAAASLNTDTALQVRAVFTGSQTTNTLPATLTLDRRASSAGSDSVGPGSVNLLTGDYSISDSDGGAFGISVSRTFSSLYPTAGTSQAGQAGPFGGQWTSGADVPDSDFTTLEIGTNSATVSTADGSGIEFLLNNGTWTAEPGMTDLTLTGPVSGAYTLTDAEGTATVFTKPSTNASVYAISSVTPPGTATTTKYVYEAVVDNPGTAPVTRLRLKRIIAPTSAFADLNSCNVATPPVGCRILDVDYPTVAGVPTGTNLGDYYPSTTVPSGARAKSVTMWAATPASGGTPAAILSTVIAQYAYDSTGNLRELWDPRISPPLKTLYTYDGNSRVATVTEAGQQPWTLSYDSNGRLSTAARPTLTAGTSGTTNGTATHSVVYNVPLTGTGAPNDLSATARATWGQTSVPTTATAVIGPDPSSGAGSTTAFSRGTVHYLDIEGNETNTASNGNFDATDLDTFGNTIRELTPGNRALAMTDPAGTDPADQAARDELAALGLTSLSSADRATALSTRSVYDDAGVLLLDTYGPRQPILLEAAVAASGASPALPAGSNVLARAHTHTTYDENRPGTAVASNLATTVTSGAQIVGREAAPDADVRTTTTAFDWTLGSPTSTTTDPGTGNLNITRGTTYDSSGRVWKTRMPNSAGGDAGETITTYYTGTGTGTCAGRPEWADLLCQIAPGGAITGGGSNPSQLVTKTFTYTRTGQSATVTETANSVTRTTTTSYDSADRTDTVSITGGVGTAVPPMKSIYDTNSGAVTETQTLSAVGGSVTARIERSYDTLGRVMTYKDADGATTTTSYDAGDRPTTITSVDAGSSPVSRTAMTYDAGIEPRGMATSVTFGTSASDPSPLTWTGRYDNESELSTADLPGSVQLSTGDDTVGNTTHRTYTQTGVTSPLLEDQAEYSIHGQQLTHDGLTHQDYGYDAAGRLLAVQDTSPDGSGAQQCTTRAYSYNSNSNRLGTASTTGPAAVGDAAAACPTAPTVSTSMSYDSADRLITSGYVYDAFGRTTSLPGGLTNAFYTTDLVASQTLGSRTQTWTLDPNMRFRASTTTISGTATTATNHYDADNDNPAWITEPVSGTTTNRRYTTTLDGSLIDIAGSTKLMHLSNIHGDNTLALDLSTTSAPLTIQLADEFGIPLGGGTGRYNWLGNKQRSTDATGGVILMGVRLYSPLLGRFLSVDPIVGGNANPYDYCTGDPINCTDLDGRWGIRKHFKKHWKKYAFVASLAVGGGAIGGALMAYKAVRIVQLARAGGGSIRASRATAYMAGRMWTGRGARWAPGKLKNGSRMLSKGNKHYRTSAYKPNQGRRSSNLERHQPGHHMYTNFHINHRSRMF